MYTPFTLLSTFPTFCLPTLFSLFSTPSPQYHPIPSHLQLSPLPPFYFRPSPTPLYSILSSPLLSHLHSTPSPHLASLHLPHSSYSSTPSIPSTLPLPFPLLFISPPFSSSLYPLYSLPPSPLLPPSSLFSSLPSPIRHISTPPPFPSPPLLYLLPSIFLSYNPSFL